MDVLARWRERLAASVASRGLDILVYVKGGKLDVVTSGKRRETLWRAIVNSVQKVMSSRTMVAEKSPRGM